MNKSIHHSEEICNILKEKNLLDKMSEYAKVYIIALRVFISTDSLLSTQQILDMYAERWNMEVFFRSIKNKLAFDKYQIRSANGIKRYWMITSLAYILACLESKSFDFSEGYHILQDKINIEHILFIFDYAANGGDKSALLQMAS